MGWIFHLLKEWNFGLGKTVVCWLLLLQVSKSKPTSIMVSLRGPMYYPCLDAVAVTQGPSGGVNDSNTNNYAQAEILNNAPSAEIFL